MSTSEVDLLILGSGSTAFAAALRAQELGRTSLMIEERTVGGTCVNRGCLPSKNLIEAARLVYDARHPRYPGLSPAELGVDFRALVKQKDEVVHGYRQKKYDSLTGGKFSVEEGHAEFADPHTVAVNGRRFRGKAVLIATGSRPVIPEVEGLSRVPFLTSDLLTVGERDEMTELPRSLLILGAGYIALELGQMFSRFGVEVTLLERNSELLSNGYEPEIGPTVREILEFEGIRILRPARLLRVRNESDSVIAEIVHAAGRETLKADRLLVAAGRQPNTDRIGIERSGVQVDARWQIRVNEFLRTSVGHVFAAGDVIGAEQYAQMATPVGSQDGGIAAHNALADEPRRVNHRVIPRAIFIDPPVAVVGMTERDAIAAGHACWCRALPMSLVPRAGAIRDTRGIVKMVADAVTSEVLGVTMIGNGAAEVIHEAAMALRFRAKLHDFIDQLHVYPTMAEALKIAAISRFKDPARLSCCAE